MPAKGCLQLQEPEMAKKRKLLAACVCIVDATSIRKLNFKASSAASLDIEFTKSMHCRYVSYERFNTAALALVAVYYSACLSWSLQ